MYARLGKATLDNLREAVQISLLPYAALKGAYLEQGRGQRVVVSTAASQVYYTAVEPLPIFLMIATTLGFFSIVACDYLMRPNGLAPHVPNVVAQAVVREVSPIIIALILVGRSGTAIATELGYMRVNEEIDALAVAGINIDYFLVLPRIVGVTVASVGLTVVTAAAALVGGFLLGEGLSLLSAGLQFEQILRSMSLETIGLAVTKALVFGLIISTVNCFHGLSVGRSFTEIPRANVRGAVQCYLAVFFLNSVISVYAILQQL